MIQLMMTITTTWIQKCGCIVGNLQLSNFNKVEKYSIETRLQSKCQESDDKLTAFVGILHLECFKIYQDDSDENLDDNEKHSRTVPQQLVNCWAPLGIVAIMSTRKGKKIFYCREGGPIGGFQLLFKQ